MLERKTLGGKRVKRSKLKKKKKLEQRAFLEPQPG